MYDNNQYSIFIAQYLLFYTTITYIGFEP